MRFVLLFLRPFREVLCFLGYYLAAMFLAPWLLIYGRTPFGRYVLGLLHTIFLGVLLFGCVYNFAVMPIPEVGFLLVFYSCMCILLPTIISHHIRLPGPGGRLAYWPEVDFLAAGIRLIALLDLRMSREHRKRFVREAAALLAEYSPQKESLSETLLEPLIDLKIIDANKIKPNPEQISQLDSSIVQHQPTEKPPVAALDPPRGLYHAYRGLAGRWQPPHRYEITPENWNGLVTIVFLHGHGGNLLLYPYAWKEFASRWGVRIAMPTFSYGNWESPRALPLLEKLMDEFDSEYAGNAHRVFLAGISQGGAGVSRAAAAMPTRFAGLIYFSPTMEMPVLQSDDFVNGWRERPILVFQGGRDRQVAAESVALAVDSMRGAKMKVTYLFEEEEDHFFFFGQRARVLDVVGNWMQAI